MSNVRPINRNGPPGIPPPTMRVCPLLTIAIPKAPPSAIVGTDKKLDTVNCVGMNCAFFHPIGACAFLLVADATLTQASIAVSENAEPKQPESAPSA